MKKQKEIDPEDGFLIDDADPFGLWYDNKVEDFSDLMHKYFRPFYRLFKHRIPDGCRKLKWGLQRLFRKSSCSDLDIWNLAFYMGPDILKKLKAFREYQEKLGNGYPAYFSEWGYEGCEDKYGGMGMLKEDYDKARAEGRYGGGESAAWLATLDEMIFAFEYRLLDCGFDKKEERFYQKWGLVNPHRKTEDNMSWSYGFKKADGSHLICSKKTAEELDKLKEEGWQPLNKHRNYMDIERIREYDDRAEKGMALFGKFYWNLWD